MPDSAAPSPSPLPPCVILCGPQMGENIGACARAMKNCGLDDLRLVDPRVGELTAGIKTLEAEKGLTFDGADASFELYTRQQFGQSTSYFSLDRFRVIDERRHNAKGDEVTESMAMVQLEVADQAYIEAAPGNGPVDAINAALRKALLPVYPVLEDMQLTDYRVRILDGRSGTAAITRVMIESADASGRTWTCLLYTSDAADE